MRRSTLTAGTIAAAIILIPLTTQTALAGPPGIPTVVEAQSELAAIEITDESHANTYHRSMFIHWARISGQCDARELVLIRDGEAVETDANCSPISGTWTSPYDGGVWTDPEDIDIDHMVPLKEAWRSGAWAWDSARRKAFANSLDDSQLWAVTDNVNQSKADKDPSRWKPPLESFSCEYARSWIDVKHDWGLSMQVAEREALAEMLATC
ncbi:HNH endonuclease family protein [Nonomuraea sp. NPDC048881]|uniref:HNH endonuclease family protein n=1 Tax=Nonomuraea sp. NPDC048881 TaxID=3155030 RepID=UPI0033C84180